MIADQQRKQSLIFDHTLRMDVFITLQRKRLESSDIVFALWLTRVKIRVRKQRITQILRREVV